MRVLVFERSVYEKWTRMNPKGSTFYNKTKTGTYHVFPHKSGYKADYTPDSDPNKKDHPGIHKLGSGSKKQIVRRVRAHRDVIVGRPTKSSSNG